MKHDKRIWNEKELEILDLIDPNRDFDKKDIKDVLCDGHTLNLLSIHDSESVENIYNNL